MEQKTNEIRYFNVLKAIACIAIVFLHTFFGADGAFNPTTQDHVISLCVKNSMLWAVPCFVMISGALLLDKNRNISYKKIFCKYIARMIIALVLFSFLFSLFDSLISEKGFSSDFLLDALKDIAFGTGWSHMWYIYMMIAIYLMLPIFRMIIKQASDKDLIYIICLLAVFQSVIPLINTSINNNIAFYITVSTVYPLYFLLGYALHNNIIKINMKISILITVVSTVALWLLSCSDAVNSNKIIHALLADYSFPITAIQSVGIFEMFKNGGEVKNKIFYGIWKEISLCSFGIYIVHMAIIKFIFVKLDFDPYMGGGIATLIGIALIAFVISWAFIRLCKFVPGLKKII